MFIRTLYTLLSFCLVGSLNSQTIGVSFDVDYSVGGGNKKVIVSYCATMDFVPVDGTDDWGAQWLTIGFEPGTGIVAASPSTQLTGFASSWLPFVEAFGATGGNLNTFTPSQVGGTDDGNVYIALKIDGSTTNKPLADGVCEVVFEFLVPMANGTGATTEMFLLDEAGLPGSAFAFQPNILNNGTGGNVYDGVEPSSSLPIKIHRFDAKKGEDDVLLKWSTSSEINGSHFEIERSQDLTNWTQLGKVNAMGESSSIQNYAFLDDKLPLNARTNHKIFYYRLNMVDNDGASDYSDVRSVRFDFDGDADFLVYPNPSFNEIYVNLSSITPETGPATMQIVNVNGQLVKNVTLSTSDDIRIDVSDLTAGVYHFVARQGEQTFVQKVIKID